MMANETRKWWALAALTLAVLAVGLDGTVLSVALPTLAGALHATESDLQWFFSGYLLVLAAAMLPAGLMGDRFGRKRIMLAALALFGVGSAACAYAPSPAFFTAARVLLGIAGAGIVVMALSALTVLFSEQERPRAVGVWAAANFLALPIGPILGGWLVTNYWWGWVFLINVPVALIGFAATAALVPESRAPKAPALDLPGILGSTAGLVGLTYGLIEAGQEGWTAAAALLPMALGLAILVAFFMWESRAREPLVDPSLFRSRAFTWGVILAGIAALALVGVLFTMPQYFQGVGGTDAMGSGIRLLPLIGGLVLGALPADRVAAKLGAKGTVAIGFALLMLGLGMGARSTVASSDAFTAAWMAAVGAGMGLAIATATSGALSEVSQERSGVGSAVMQAVQKVGAPFGSAILGSVLSAGYQAHVSLAGLPPAAAAAVKSGIFGGLAVARRAGSASLAGSVRAAFVQGMSGALLVSAGVALAGLLLALAFLPWRTAHAAEQDEGQLLVA